MLTRITRKPWFGPKRFIGWGWTPTTWEGTAVLVVFGVLAIGSVIVWQGWGAGIAVPLLVALLLVVALLTGDPPGGPRLRR